MKSNPLQPMDRLLSITLSQSALMTSPQKLLWLCVLLPLIVTCCAGALHTHSKHGAAAHKGGSGKTPPSSQGGRLPKQGLKWAAAAAGMLGGTGTGYGLGFLGKPKHKSGGHGGAKSASTEQRHHQDRQRHNNQSRWRAFLKAAAPPADINNLWVTLGHTVTLVFTAWMASL
ncbi:shadow of prion protein 2 [Entelurus aequoreus]|uniref:shadow of prion protein 2 n=1 Tax=Entelurus aequoreus TaxID=161455 RepID=UPI002B1D6B2F|nr:shadow of prion protein 2 [Entelurus aequoreus]